MAHLTQDQLRIRALRAALRIALQCMRHADVRHAVVDPTRPHQGLAKYINRVLEDTKP